MNEPAYRAEHGTPAVEPAPLPSCAQFLNVIEAVFSGMARAIIHNSDYASVDAAKAAIDRYFAERHGHFQKQPRRAGNKLWRMEKAWAAAVHARDSTRLSCWSSHAGTSHPDRALVMICAATVARPSARAPPAATR